MDADFLAGVVTAALQDEFWTGPGRDDRSLLLQLALRTGARLLGNVVCRLKKKSQNYIHNIQISLATDVTN